MGGESFGFRQRDYCGAYAGQAITRELLDRDCLHKILNAQPAAKACSRACG